MKRYKEVLLFAVVTPFLVNAHVDGPFSKKPTFVAGEILQTYYDGVNDDLLTGGLGKTGLEDGSPPPMIVDPENPTVAELRRLAIYNNYRALVDTIELATIDSMAYKNAVLAFFEALLREQDERLDSLSRWLMGVTTSPADTKILRDVGVTGKITKPNAFRMLRSLAQIVRALSYSGLLLLFDEVDRMASIGGKAERLATDNLREVIDRCRDEMPGAMFVYAVPPQFVNDVVPRYPALQQRIRTPGRFSRINHFSPQISLEHLDLDENDLMLAIGEKLIPIYETAFNTKLDAQTQYANAAILANVARDVFLDVSHRRLFVKSFVMELARQQATEEHFLTEEEAIAIIRGQVDELSGGETPPGASPIAQGLVWRQPQLSQLPGSGFPQRPVSVFHCGVLPDPKNILIPMRTIAHPKIRRSMASGRCNAMEAPIFAPTIAPTVIINASLRSMLTSGLNL